jgi:hypothetical protein
MAWETAMNFVFKQSYSKAALAPSSFRTSRMQKRERDGARFPNSEVDSSSGNRTEQEAAGCGGETWMGPIYSNWGRIRKAVTILSAVVPSNRQKCNSMRPHIGG